MVQIAVPARPELRTPVDALESAMPDNPTPLSRVVDTLTREDAVIQWRRFDADDESTWPHDVHNRNTVLALVSWTKLNHKRPNGTPAVFYQAHLGEYHRCEDGEVRFLLDHGNGSLDEPGEEGDDYVDASQATWWTYIITPERAGLD